jgi:dCMP deaminase
MASAFLSALRSNDSEHKTGACVVNTENKIVGIGYRGMPQNIPSDGLPWNSESATDPLDVKHWYVCHAAMNAILNKNQEDIHGCRLYCTHLPCNECTKIIIQSGIKRIVYANEPPSDCVKAKATRILCSLVGISLVRYSCGRNISIDLSIDDYACLFTNTSTDLPAFSSFSSL